MALTSLLFQLPDCVAHLVDAGDGIADDHGGQVQGADRLAAAAPVERADNAGEERNRRNTQGKNSDGAARLRRFRDISDTDHGVPAFDGRQRSPQPHMVRRFGACVTTGTALRLARRRDADPFVEVSPRSPRSPHSTAPFFYLPLPLSGFVHGHAGQTLPDRAAVRCYHRGAARAA